MDKVHKKTEKMVQIMLNVLVMWAIVLFLVAATDLVYHAVAYGWQSLETYGGY